MIKFLPFDTLRTLLPSYAIVTLESPSLTPDHATETGFVNTIADVTLGPAQPEKTQSIEQYEQEILRTSSFVRVIFWCVDVANRNDTRVGIYVWKVAIVERDKQPVVITESSIQAPSCRMLEGTLETGTPTALSREHAGFYEAFKKILGNSGIFLEHYYDPVL